MFKRLLEMKLPKKQSAFLWGARQTGKSTFLEKHFPQSIFYNLLKSDEYWRLLKAPHLLREEVLALNKGQLSRPIIIDEIQKVPSLLDEVHWLIENTDAQFILCGSSARKLRRVGVNLLGGRAWRYHFYPLVSKEIPKFDLLRALNHGLVPSHYLSEHPVESLEAYVLDYLDQEIKQEGLVRDLPEFSRFLDSLGYSHGELTNYANIARDCGVSAKTARAYYDILVDTLLGFFLEPYHRRSTRGAITKTAKFYLFDVGVAGYLSKRNINELAGVQAGEAFEHFIIMELMAYKGLNKKRFDIKYWRIKSGLEVDFILGDAEVAIEVKISRCVAKQDLKGLIAFCQDYQPKQAIVVSQDPKARAIVINDQTKILVLPWKDFLMRLWSGDFI